MENSNKLNVLIYSNCTGTILKKMFDLFSIENKFSINLFINYENLHKREILDKHLEILNNCDIFIYQPIKPLKIESQYEIKSITKYLKKSVKIIKVNFYRFKGFWYDSNFKPYNNFDQYLFNLQDIYGIHNSIINLKLINYQSIKDFVDNISINEKDFNNYFDESIKKLKEIDNNSDVKLFDFFINNYRKTLLFHDPYHPTNKFIFEIFIKINEIIDNHFSLTSTAYKMRDSYDSIINNIDEMTQWASPILPQVKTILNLENYPDKIKIFYPNPIEMNIYDYYYIRISKNNFKEYLLYHKIDNKDKNIILKKKKHL